MVNTKFLQFIAKCIAIICLLMQGHVLCNGGLNSQFIASEVEALLKFKEGLKDPSNLLSSWKHGKDCCQWKGIGCNTTTGHVISLNLHCSNSRNAPYFLKFSDYKIRTGEKLFFCHPITKEKLSSNSKL
ncbi:putative leucine-rich repeat-containing, plant-type, leucine-rich repeat domain, L [Medicago truncatula]|uniref:Putative leucine-rich repeat-containing, plant-type, leucine-rich repeat domain, L n=1 Tax=Medicago truncatula TaxID=3880 RepID=A0A396I435_MEDTR|nr:putative leucine-rich repeat-containing, plant-type, leucine-rich repeat domain, L [Medicago truncatula]